MFTVDIHHVPATQWRSGCLVPLVAGACPAGQQSTLFLNPFGPQTPAGLPTYKLIRYLARSGRHAELKSATGIASRQFGQLPGGTDVRRLPPRSPRGRDGL